MRCVECGHKLKRVKLGGYCPYCGEQECYVNEWGDAVCVEAFGSDELWTFTEDDEDAVLCKPCAEYLLRNPNTLIVVAPDVGRVKVLYDNGKVMFMDYDDGSRWERLSGDVQRAVVEIVRGTYWHSTDAWRGYYQPPKEAGVWVRAADGWHSSMEPSQLSELINELTSGRRKLAYPFAIVFAKTSNVCSIGLSAYCPSEFAEEFGEMLKSAKAAPDYAGMW